MRISDNRYSRDRFRFDLAMRFIRHEARTHTIRAWTGLSDDRIRKLYRHYSDEHGNAVSRPRGKSPHSTYISASPAVRYCARSKSASERARLRPSIVRSTRASITGFPKTSNFPAT